MDTFLQTGRVRRPSAESSVSLVPEIEVTKGNGGDVSDVVLKATRSTVHNFESERGVYDLGYFYRVRFQSLFDTPDKKCRLDLLKLFRRSMVVLFV